jgi:hypothetical protein
MLGPAEQAKAAVLQREMNDATRRRDRDAVLAFQGQQAAPVDPIRLIVPILKRFIATDRGFAKSRRGSSDSDDGSDPIAKR